MAKLLLTSCGPRYSGMLRLMLRPEGHIRAIPSAYWCNGVIALAVVLLGMCTRIYDCSAFASIRFYGFTVLRLMLRSVDHTSRSNVIFALRTRDVAEYAHAPTHDLVELDELQGQSQTRSLKHHSEGNMLGRRYLQASSGFQMTDEIIQSAVEQCKHESGVCTIRCGAWNEIWNSTFTCPESEESYGPLHTWNTSSVTTLYGSTEPSRLCLCVCLHESVYSR